MWTCWFHWSVHGICHIRRPYVSNWTGLNCSCSQWCQMERQKLPSNLPETPARERAHGTGPIITSLLPVKGQTVPHPVSLSRTTGAITQLAPGGRGHWTLIDRPAPCDDEFISFFLSACRFEHDTALESRISLSITPFPLMRGFRCTLRQNTRFLLTALDIPVVKRRLRF